MSVDISDRVFDAYTGEMGPRFMRETQRRVHWMCAAARGTSVLDVGCSQGLLPILLGREGKTVVGIDMSSAAIASANENLMREHVSVRRRVSFVEADLIGHQFGDMTFECVVMGEVLEHLLDPARLVQTVAKLLAPGGRVVVTVPFGINDHLDHKQTFYLLEPMRLLEPYFELETPVVLGRWLGLIGTRRAQELPAPARLWTQDEVEALEAAFEEIERSLVDDLAAVRKRLDDANVKYRSSNEELAKLKREAAHHEAERKASERARAQLEQQLAQAALLPAPGQAELQAARDVARARELEAARLEERLTHAVQLRSLELAVRESEIERLQKDRDELTRRALEGEQRAKASDEGKADAQARAAAAEEQTRQAEQRHLLVANIVQQAEERAIASEQRALDAEQRTLDAEQRAIASERRALDAEQRAEVTAEQARVESASRAKVEAELHSALQDASEREAVATERAVALEAALESVQRQASEDARRSEESARAESERAQAALDEARMTRDELRVAREAAAAAQADLAAAVSRASSLASELQSAEGRIARLEAQPPPTASALLKDRLCDLEITQQTTARELARQRTMARELDRRLEQEKRGRVAAERKVVQTQNTLSFQLGYELIHGFKSRQRLRMLPSKLLALQKEAARRRDERAARDMPQISHEPDLSSRAPAPLASTPARPATPAPRSGVEAPDLTNVSSLRVACIHDEFTFASYAPECNLLPLTPANWEQELTAFAPQLLFVESAWRGKDDLWGKKVSHRSREVVDLVEHCRKRGIPTAFWNKEDPVHFGTFINTAKLFDHVFTTDVDCIPRYRRALGHDRVHLLPFACQPAQHNPLEKYQRKDALCFAGAYYARYPERQRDLESFARNFGEAPRLEIFDRNYGKSDPSYAFPEEYRQFIVGTLPFEEIDRAYKGYRYALNLNSIKDSQTMFARRVYELLASNTVTVSNFSRGIRLMFGDLVVSTDRGELALTAIQQLAADPGRAGRLRLAGLRKVLTEHTYGHRLRFIASSVWGQTVDDRLPEIVVVARARSEAELADVCAAFERQVYPHKKLVISTELPVATALPPGALKLGSADAKRRELRSMVPARSLLATFEAADHYGKHYLLDLALTTTYSKAKAIGKAAHYQMRDGRLSLVDDGSQYRVVGAVVPRRALINGTLVATRSLNDWLAAAHQPFELADSLAVDEYNYCEGAASSTGVSAVVDDLTDLDAGLPLDRLVRAHDSSPLDVVSRAEQRAIPGERLAKLFRVPSGKPITLSAEAGAMLVHSSLADDAHEYVYAGEHWKLSELGLPQSTQVHFDAAPGLNLQLAIRFLDSRKQRLGHQLCAAAKNETLVPPPGAELVQLGLRVYGVGSAKVGGLLLGHVPETPGTLFGRSDVLLLTNHYPAYDDLYRNGFVHRRVVDYRRQGARVDVFRHRPGHKLGYREFDGVDVLSGGRDALTTLLRSHRYRAVLVHFLDPAMWEVLRTEAQGARVLLWLHGAEVQAWHRRTFGPQTDLEREEAKAKSAKRDTFWRKVYKELPADGKLIFVSRHFAQQTLADLGLPEDGERCQVIHNLVDGRLFRYHEKTPDLRKKVLSIRPFASRKYANDLSVTAILELAKQPYFEDMSFHLVGDGPLFEETVAPLRGFPNVRIERCFLSQQEIAELHAQYGVFLCPTRDDTQGVSRDEAMASGLVPVTTRIAAIPEFVDETCGVLAEPDSGTDLARGMARLYEDPALFQRLSRSAATRVRAQSSAEQTTERELELIMGGAR